MNIKEKIEKYQIKSQNLENEKRGLIEEIEIQLSEMLGLNIYYEQSDFDIMLFSDVNEEIYIKIRFSNFSVYDISTSNKELEEKVYNFFENY